MSACAAPGARLEARVPVEVLTIATEIHEPVVSFHTGTDTLLALTHDNRIAKIDTATTHTTYSKPFASIGRNLQISPVDSGIVLLPQPAAGNVAAVRIGDLQQVATVPAGPQPSYLSQDSGDDVLLALSADATTVSALDLHRNKLLGSQPVAGTHAETTVEGSRRGRVLEFHTCGPEGIAHYKGHEMPIEQNGRLGIGVENAAADPAKVTRVYVAEKNSPHLFAVDTDRGGDALHVVGEASLAEPVRRIGVDDTRLYAATDSRLVVFESESFEGYRHDHIPVLRSFDYRTELPSYSARIAPLAGLAVGRNYVYLALVGEPYLLRVAKPDV